MPASAEDEADADEDAALDEDCCEALDPPHAASEMHSPSEHMATAARETRERLKVVRMAHHTTVQP